MFRQTRSVSLRLLATPARRTARSLKLSLSDCPTLREVDSVVGGTLQRRIRDERRRFLRHYLLYIAVPQVGIIVCLVASQLVRETPVRIALLGTYLALAVWVMLGF